MSTKKNEKGIKADFYNAYFLKEYSKIFDYDMLVNAEYINQYNYNIQKEYPSQEEKMKYAEHLVKCYSEASCVITSRIHCALPCTGLETPVIFVENTNDSKYSTDRFGGLINLFNTITWDGLHLTNTLTKQKIDRNNFPKVKTGWENIANRLINSCLSFIKSSS
ncbi:polysaccharide pyruvyl transferase family protein [Bacteroides gallinarum]|uniref:polysaccharide pyruvyl transferase family protein n=1 Tax=Bacteroides gallinarum TaxID=376806 RepID=UPI00277D1541|nr:polysaccharide pyruvyl transferase family protein [Bacteroides gallinarum]